MLLELNLLWQSCKTQRADEEKKKTETGSRKQHRSKWAKLCKSIQCISDLRCTYCSGDKGFPVCYPAERRKRMFFVPITSALIFASRQPFIRSAQPLQKLPPLYLNTLQRKRWFHYSALGTRFRLGRCFRLSAVSAAHLAELETTCHLRLLSSPWQSGANDLEGKTVPLHMGPAACVRYIFVHLRMHFVSVCIPVHTFAQVVECLLARAFRASPVVFVCFRADGGLGPFLQLGESQCIWACGPPC